MGLSDPQGEGEILAKSFTCLLMIHQGVASISDCASYRMAKITCCYCCYRWNCWKHQ